MKIAFITLSCAYNYGAVLQAYAMWKYLQNLGNETVLIDYITERYQVEAKDHVFKVGGRWAGNAFMRMIWKTTYYKIERKVQQHFKDFLRKNTRLTPTYYNNEELIEKPVQADLFISGSDQIWNTDFSLDKKPDKPYFLDFAAEDKPRLAYASSFGKNRLGEEKKEIKKYLEKFQAIGVREKSAIKIIDELGLKAEIVADPTLLCSREEWSGMAAGRMEEKKYLLLFQIHPKKELLELGRKLAKEKGLSLVIVSPNPLDRKKMYKWKVRYLPKVEEWLSYFKFAEFVLTDSFHATVFSTIFEKQFLTYAQNKYNSRITGYLSVLGLPEKSVSNFSSEQIEAALNRRVDYGVVTPIRKEFTEKSKQWLVNQLDLCKRNQKMSAESLKGKIVL